MASRVRKIFKTNLFKIISVYLAAIVCLEIHAFADATKTVGKKSGDKKMSDTFAIFDTSMGKFKARLFADKAPVTVKNFTDLAEGKKELTDESVKHLSNKPYFDGQVFHRVIPNFMIQGGDPLGNGTGGPGYTIKDEFHPELKHNKKGLLSMANRGPNTGGSQFFVTVAETPWLDGKHAIFGEVIEGYDIAEKISNTPRGSGDRPTTPVKINSVTIERK